VEEYRARTRDDVGRLDEQIRYLIGGDLDQARTALDDADRDFPDEDVFQVLRADLETEVRRRECLRRARDQMARHEYAEAEKTLEDLIAIRPDESATVLLQTVRTRIEEEERLRREERQNELLNRLRWFVIAAIALGGVALVVVVTLVVRS
jgi:hypothetical protein